MKKFSLIVPFYYNEKNIKSTLNELYSVLKQISNNFEVELIFIDDGSKDSTWDLLNQEISDEFDHKLIKLSKNFGSHSAILAGLSVSEGDAVGLITSDLQDPPELFLEMLKHWQEGFQAVLAVRKARSDGIFQILFSNLYYRLLNKFSNANMPLGGFDFFVIDKKVAGLLVDMSEKNSSITCQISWAGFNKKIIYYQREKRKIGKSSWTFNKKMKLFIDSFMAFSVFPLRLIQIAAGFFSFVGFIYLIIIIFLKINNKIPIHGIATVIGILCISSGLILFSLSIIGEYIWRILDQVRNRPIFIIEEYLKIKKSPYY